ncbi:MAG: hypothetical protein INR64_08425 [Caulobacteraceae bacterium]|nr:hypothetical protein [Caulobacter sp.]
MNALLRFDRAQLAVADAVVLWLWDRLELSHRTLLRLALAGMLLSQMLAQIAMEARVEITTLLLAALLVFMFESNARRLGGSPELRRAIMLANRRRPFSVFVRLAVWPWTLYSIAASLGSRALPLEVTGDLCFLVLVFAAHALPPGAPPRRRRREAREPAALGMAPQRFGG